MDTPYTREVIDGAAHLYLHKLQTLLTEKVPDEKKIHEAVMGILETGDNIIRLTKEERRKYDGQDNRG